MTMVKHNEATNMLKNVLFLVVLLYVTVVLSMYLLQRKMMYFPHEAPEHTHYEVLDIASDGLMIKVVAEGSQLEQAVIYFGGNGEDIYAGAERMQAAFMHKAAYYVNYPGYGGSSGSPTETTLTQSARAVYEYVSARHSSVAVVGRSLGTGVAVKLSSEYAVSHLVLISPYDSIANVASKYYPFFPSSLIKDKFDSASLASKIRAKTLIIMASDDIIIPISHSQRLIEALNQTQPINQVYKQANHNNVHLMDGFMGLIRDFLGQ
jgi:esterase/lipase